MPAGSTRSSVGGSRGGSSAIDAVSFSHSRSLDIPRSHNDDKQWSAFFSDAVQLVLRAYSLAKALGMDSEASLSSATRLTAPLLTEKEAKEYSEWEQSKRMPRADWKRLRTEVRANTNKQTEKWEELTFALRKLYDDDSIGMENAKAWVEKYDDKMPLLIAAKKVDQTRWDVQRAGKSSTLKKHVHEAIACRKLLSEIGMYRGNLGQDVKEVNVKITKKEQDLLKDLAKLEKERLRSKDMAADLFKERGKLYDKLTRLRMDRVANGIRHSQLMAESKMAEETVRSRMRAIDDKLTAERRRRA